MENGTREIRALAFLDVSSQMGRRVAGHDWAATSLGPISSWPAALKIAVGLVLRSGFPKCLCWGPDQLAIYNDAFTAIIGDADDYLGRSCAHLWQKSWQRIEPIAASCMRGEASFLRDLPIRIAGSEKEGREVFLTFSISPVVDEFGHIHGFMQTVIETTDRVRFERKAAISNRELVHRVKNSYALVSAVVGQIARTCDTKDELRSKVVERLSDMGRAQEVLSLKNDGRDAGMTEVVRQALLRFDEDGQRIRMDGPPLQLGDEQTFALALALFELGTNSMKYGALSAAGGRVDVSWQNDDTGFRFHWQESGGPPVEVPLRSGFGSFLIKQLLPAEFGAEVTVTYDQKGYSFSLAGPRFAGGS